MYFSSIKHVLYIFKVVVVVFFVGGWGGQTNGIIFLICPVSMHQ